MSWFKNLFGKKKKKKPAASSIARDEKGRWIYEVPSATKHVADLQPRVVSEKVSTKSKSCGCKSGSVCPCEKKKETPKAQIKPVAKKPVAKKPVAKKTPTPKKK
jgi:hypothetical protein